MIYDGRRQGLVEREGGFVLDKWFSFWPKHPRLLELPVFLSQAFNFILHFHVMTRGELPRSVHPSVLTGLDKSGLAVP